MEVLGASNATIARGLHHDGLQGKLVGAAGSRTTTKTATSSVAAKAPPQANERREHASAEARARPPRPQRAERCQGSAASRRPSASGELDPLEGTLVLRLLVEPGGKRGSSSRARIEAHVPMPGLAGRVRVCILAGHGRWPPRNSPLACVERGLHLALDGALADPEPLRDRLVALLVRRPQQEHLPAARRQREQGALHDADCLLHRDDALGLRRLVRQLREPRVVLPPVRAPLPEAVVREVRRRPEHGRTNVQLDCPTRTGSHEPNVRSCATSSASSRRASRPRR